MRLCHDSMYIRSRREILLLLLTTSIFPLVQGAYREEFGARDRFWKHQQRNRTIKIKGVEQYQNIERCLQKNKAKENIDEESKENANVQYAHKKNCEQAA